MNISVTAVIVLHILLLTGSTAAFIRLVNKQQDR